MNKSSGVNKLLRWNKESIKPLVVQYASKIFFNLKKILVEIILTLLVWAVLAFVFNSAETRQDQTNLAYIYLISSYLLFAGLCYIKFQFLKRTGPRSSLLVCLLNKYYIYLSLVIGFMLILVLESQSQVRHLYNFSTLLGYGLFLYHVILFTHTKLNLKTHNFNRGSLKKYVSYAVVLAFLFFFSTTMDQSDPYGPNFQLKIVFWLLLAHLVVSWFLSQWKWVKQLENERTNAELLHLKSQVNPHFLFNTLNNLYGLALEKSDQTPELILKLSNMLRYTIYQGRKDEVALEDEISYLENYIDLQQIRNQQRVQINFQQSLGTGKYKIAPLLLIILLENAYKHGVEQLAENSFIHIQLKVDNFDFSFNVINNFETSSVTTEQGIGLENLVKRLELIYPNRYDFKTVISSSTYTTQLNIQLDNQKNGQRGE